MLGKFLEISIHSDDILASLSFYQALGFTELAAGEVWSHQYAVVSDGNVALGFHSAVFDSPKISFVRPELRTHALKMTDGGTHFTFQSLDDDVFNELEFLDRDGHTVSLLEARTFSPGGVELGESLCGTLLEYSLPAREPLTAAHFWAPLAPAVLANRDDPEVHFRFDASGLPLGLSGAAALKRPALCYRCANKTLLNDALERSGINIMATQAYESAFAQLRGPEGTDLFLFEEDFL